MGTPSLSEYFVTFIDDFLRMTWLYLMKDWTKRFGILCAFCDEMKTQFNVSIRVLRSDNAREYFFNPFISFMTQLGMIH